MTIRPLTLQDENKIEDLIDSREMQLGVSSDAWALHRTFSYKNTLDLIECGPSVGVVFGAFDDANTLTGMLITAISQAQPCFFIRKAHTRPGSDLSILSDLFQTAMLHYEDRGFLRSYTAYRQRDIAAYLRLWRTNKVLQNYVSYTDLVIMPNTRPKHSDVWQYLLGRSLSPETLVVRAFIKRTDTMIIPT